MEKQAPLHAYFDSPLALIPTENDSVKINMEVYDQKNLVNQLS
jgi:hypothetical protein